MKVKLPFCLILLMITSVAWADTKTLYHMSATWNDYCIGGPFGTLFKTPQKAQRMCGLQYYDLVGPINQWGDYGLAKDGTTWLTITALTKSCELKDIPGKGTNGTHDLFFDGASKAPNMVRRCINNCEVEDRRVKKEGAAAGSDYGGAVCTEDPVTGKPMGCSADYTRIQTGAVCIQNPGEKDDTKYDDVTANPGDDNGNGADGTGNEGDGTKDKSDNPGQPPKQDGRDDSKTDNGANGSDGSGNQNGGQGGTGADSPRDSGSADEPVEDKDKDKDKDKPGKGKGKGGGGGGNHGDKDKDDKDKEDSGKADDKGEPGKGGSGQGGDDKGDDKGDGKDGDKGDGKDNQNGSPNGTDNGTGTGGGKDGQGSGISGDDCKSGKAPQCKGET